jgi:hypothetical protein
MSFGMFGHTVHQIPNSHKDSGRTAAMADGFDAAGGSSASSQSGSFSGEVEQYSQACKLIKKLNRRLRFACLERSESP